jgi:surfeit locus 1 family protein
MTGLTVVLCLLFLSLGRWQWGRAEQKRELWAQFERGTGEVMSPGTRPLSELPRYTRVRVAGRWEPRRQFLLDNRTHDGRAGYEVLTPLWLDDGRIVLVNRGWVPFGGYRDRLPDVAADFADLVAGTSGAATARVAVSGRLDELPSAGLAGGRAAPRLEGPWPRVTAFPRPVELAASLGVAPPADATTATGAARGGLADAPSGAGAEPPAGLAPRLERRLLLLDAQQPRGYVREWKPGGRGPEQNWSYAIQWWSFGVVLVGLYVGLNLRRTREESR